MQVAEKAGDAYHPQTSLCNQGFDGATDRHETESRSARFEQAT